MKKQIFWGIIGSIPALLITLALYAGGCDLRSLSGGDTYDGARYDRR